MPRNASGTFSLVSGNPVVSGTLIDATWANNTLNDIANEMTDSLSRSGEGGMLAPLRLTDGVQATPGLGFTNEPGSGLYRAGTNEWWSVAGGAQVQQHTANGALTRFAAGAVGTPSLSAFGDVNTGLWFPAADTLAASVGGVEGWRLTSTGNLGIGTSSPAVKLEVLRGSEGEYLRAGGDDTGNNGRALRFISSTGGGFIGAMHTLNAPSSGGIIAFATNSTERMRLDSSGNLGIGTSSPGYPLSVFSTANGVVSVKGGSSTNQGAAYRVELATGTGTFTAFGDRARIFGGTPDALASIFTSAAPLTFDVNGSERARLDSSGNLGIGTSSPSRKLTVNGGSNLGGSVNSILITDGTFTAGVASITAESGARIDIGTAGANAVHFWANNVERLRIESNGSIRAGAAAALATTATDGFLYVPTCAGVPTGAPTAISGMAPIVVDTTNNRWYFYSGGAWRNAGP